MNGGEGRLSSEESPVKFYAQFRCNGCSGPDTKMEPTRVASRRQGPA
jgi:hypothetical protein